MQPIRIAWLVAAFVALALAPQLVLAQQEHGPNASLTDEGRENYREKASYLRGPLLDRATTGLVGLTRLEFGTVRWSDQGYRLRLFAGISVPLIEDPDFWTPSWVHPPDPNDPNPQEEPPPVNRHWGWLSAFGVMSGTLLSDRFDEGFDQFTLGLKAIIDREVGKFDTTAYVTATVEFPFGDEQAQDLNNTTAIFRSRLGFNLTVLDAFIEAGRSVGRDPFWVFRVQAEMLVISMGVEWRVDDNGRDRGRFELAARVPGLLDHMLSIYVTFRAAGSYGPAFSLGIAGWFF